jgi:LEA14-like dessication related protein
MKKFVQACTAVLILCLFSSCRMKQLEVTGVKGFQVNKIGMDGIDADLLLGLKNPNNYGFSVFKSEFDVSYSGVHIGKAKLQKKVRIKANADETYKFKLASDFKDVNLMDVVKLLNGASFKNLIEIRGDLKAGKFLFRKKLPVDLKEKINLK